MPFRVVAVIAGSLIALIGARPAAREATAAAPDSLRSLSVGGGTVCVTTTAGAAYCWGRIGQREGRVYRLVDARGEPVALRTVEQKIWWSKCALTAAEDVACDWSLSGLRVDGAGRTLPMPAACAFYGCVVPLASRGDLAPAPLRQVSSGGDHACALTLLGVAYCWGHNHMGQLGTGVWAPDSVGSTGAVQPTPMRVVGEHRFAQISAGESTTCGITIPERAVYCWGYGQSGQVGDSSIMSMCSGTRPYHTTTCSSAVPKRVFPESLAGDYRHRSDIRFAVVSTGMRFTCGITTTNEAYCWGGNYRCALGRCGVADSPRAHLIPVPGRVVEIGAGYWHACARTADRRVYCWGDNAQGQLGSLATVNAGPDGNPPDYRDASDRGAASLDPCSNGGRCSPTPIQVAGRWVALSVGYNMACALAADDGGVYCWGGGDRAALGRNATLVTCENRSAIWKDVPCQPTPTRIPDLAPLGPPSPSAVEVAAAQPSGMVTRSDIALTQLEVGRREARVVFPAETTRAWGWLDGEAAAITAYSWRILIDTPDGVVSWGLSVPGTPLAREFRSLDSLVATGTTELCVGGMIPKCRPLGTAAVENRRVVLTLRDSAMIASLFGHRPGFVRPLRLRPADDTHTTDTIPVRYVAPTIPVPDSAARAAAARTRRSHEESINSISRSITTDGESGWREMWMAVGDSARLFVQEIECHYDACAGRGRPVSDSGWSVDDSSVVQIGRRIVRAGQYTQLITAQRPGRTTVRVTGLHGSSDTLPSSRPPTRNAARAIRVTLPLERLAIVTGSDEPKVGAVVNLAVRAVERGGSGIDSVPATITVFEGRTSRAVGMNPMRYQFRASGQVTVIAQFGRLTDTLRLVVRP